MTVYEQKQAMKSYWIPLCCAGQVSIQKAAQKIGISPRSVSNLKRRYLSEGQKCFHRPSHPPYHKVYDDAFCDMIIELYHEHWEGCPYKTFWRALQDFHQITIPYNSLRSILKKYDIKPMKEIHIKERAKHESRKERPKTGELIQMDASKHDWFMNGTYVSLHGAIDDATHTITGLYFCDNECRLGYNEVLRQTFENYGIPDAFYIDRHSSFVSTPKGKKITLEERLQAEKNSKTHFTELCRMLDIQVILALSAEAKGRIERLWQTLQGVLPFYFRYLKINTNAQANAFIQDWLPRFNREFSRAPQSSVSAFRPCRIDLDYALSIKKEKKTDAEGFFLFHDHYFKLVAPRVSYRKFTLCLSEQFGLKAFMNGNYYDVRLADVLHKTVDSSTMPDIEQDLINRYLLSNVRELIG